MPRSYYSAGYTPSEQDDLPDAEKTALFTELRDPNTTEARARVIRDKLFRAHARLALRAAREWLGSRSIGRSEDEAISAANFGLMEAMGRFDPTLGHKFATYATVWIQKRLRLLALENHTVRVPRAERDLHSALMKAVWDGETVERAANRLGITLEHAELVLELPACNIAISTHASQPSEDPRHIHSRVAPEVEIEDPDPCPVPEAVQKEEDIERITEALHRLPLDVRHCVESVVMHGQSLEATAKLLALPKSRVSSYVEQGKAAIRKYMMDTE